MTYQRLWSMSTCSAREPFSLDLSPLLLTDRRVAALLLSTSPLYRRLDGERVLSAYGSAVARQGRGTAQPDCTSRVRICRLRRATPLASRFYRPADRRLDDGSRARCGGRFQ